MPPQCQLFCPFLLKRWTERENEREKILKEIEIQISGLTYRTESTEREREQIETEINRGHRTRRRIYPQTIMKTK